MQGFTDDRFLICAIAGCSIFLYVVHLGMGKHIFAIPGENIIPLLMWIYIVSVLIPLAVGFVKLSIAFFLLTLLQRTRYRRFLWGVIGGSPPALTPPRPNSTDIHSLPRCLHALHLFHADAGLCSGFRKLEFQPPATSNGERECAMLPYNHIPQYCFCQ